MKRVLAGIAALLSMVSFVSCGSNETTSEVTKSPSTVISTGNKDSSDNEVDDEQEDYEDYEYDEDYEDDYSDDYENENSQTSYYDMLSEEYKNNPELIHLSSQKFQHEIEGKIFRYTLTDWDNRSWEEAGHDCYLESYDIENRKYSKVKLYSSTQFNVTHESIVYFDGTIYALKEDRIDISDSYSDIKIELGKYDLSGNLLASYDLGEYDDHHYEIKFISENGDVLLDESGSKITGKDLLVSSDFKSCDEIPKAEVEVEHGASEERSPMYFAIYNNEIYGTVQRKNGVQEYPVMKYNIASKKWVETTYELGAHIRPGQLVGKYAFYENEDIYTFFDIETGKPIAQVNNVFDNQMTVNSTSKSEEFAKFFKFERTHILKDNYWHEIRIYDDGSTLYDDYNVDMGYDESDDRGITVVNGEFYVLQDSYGCFLRSFKNGSSEEETIVRYDK